uniref:Uncharacterized protein n=1 Tax=Lactuca sativa TaxID=4236 RepID=A0A9R1V1P2_LACSA|nr:hypothetical protein LSAT_V11C700366350 [Lactuca sativa]
MKLGMAFKVMELTWYTITAAADYKRYQGYRVCMHRYQFYTPTRIQRNSLAVGLARITTWLHTISNFTNPLPPTTRRMPGRPSVKRRRHASNHEDKYAHVSSKGRTMQ